MTSFDHNDNPIRPKGVGGEFTVNPATGLDDPKASEDARALMHIFHERTGGGRFLTRSDFSPSDIKAYLSDILIMDVIYGDDGLVNDGIIRLMGTNVAIYYGEFTGRPVSEHLSDSRGRFVLGARAAIACNGTVIGQSAQSVAEEGNYSVKTCWVPIADDSGKMIQMLGHVQLFRLSGEALPSD